MEVLVCLANRPGDVLSREVLFREVWPDAVVCEEALTRTISELPNIQLGAKVQRSAITADSAR